MYMCHFLLQLQTKMVSVSLKIECYGSVT